MDGRIKATQKAIGKIRRRYHDKSSIQLLRRIRIDAGSFAEWIEIARIERNQQDRLSDDDKMFIAEEKRILLQANPELASVPTTNNS